jgi:hypothetical protein
MEVDMRGRGKRHAKQKLLFGHMKGKGHLGDGCVDRRIMLKCILKLWVGFI